jgi:hypothetical protein
MEDQELIIIHVLMKMPYERRNVRFPLNFSSTLDRLSNILPCLSVTFILFFFFIVTDLAAIRKILENETGGTSCPSCQMPFDKGKKRKLIDTCGHECCYSCMIRNESCTLCANTQRQLRETSSGKIVGSEATDKIDCFLDSATFGIDC